MAMECVSCGKPAAPDSERTFCKACDKEFEDGLVRASNLEARAARLEQAKEDGDGRLVGEIMAEISMEAFEADLKAKAGG